MEKADRILAILYMALLGERIIISELAAKYQLSPKSIMRDIGVIRSFLAENRDLTGNAEFKYDRKDYCYKMTREDGLQAKELLLIMKILLGSKALGKDAMARVIDKLSKYGVRSESSCFQNLKKNELEYYCPISNWVSDLADRVWRLEKAVRTGKVVHVVYESLKEPCVERDLYPISVVFSDYYFYFLACISDRKDSSVVSYRIDRIKSFTEKEERVPFDLAERHRLEAAKLYNQKMFMGDRMRIHFLYTGPSVQAILDKFSTAEIVRQNGKETELTAIVEYSRGTIMELLSQGSWIKVLGPKQLVEDIYNELGMMQNYYKSIFEKEK